MAQIIAIHSFRGGTGKSNTIANLAAALAAQGRCVGVVDTDIQSPGIHVLFGLAGQDITHTLNDYLWGQCSAVETAHDVTANVSKELSGRLYLIPASIKAGEITRVLREGYNMQRLTQGLRELIEGLGLDVVLIDTHPGLNEETLLAIVMSHTVVVVMRPDSQDYEGTAVTMQVARQLQVPHLALVVNNVPAMFDPGEVRAKVEAAYGCAVACVIPHADELMALASSGLFVLRYPDHPTSSLYRELAGHLAAQA